MPKDTEELQRLVRRSDKVRVIGERYSFSQIADTDGTLISLSKLSDVEPPTINVHAKTVSCSASATLAELATFLQRSGWALHMLPSAIHVSVAGALATATHGSSGRNLTAALIGLEYVDAEGALCCIEGDCEAHARGEEFDKTLQAVLLGAIGVITRATLRIEPTYQLRQDVYLGVPWERSKGGGLEELFYMRGLFASAYAVSLYTDWSPVGVEQAWVRRRVPEPPLPQTLPPPFPSSPPLHGMSLADDGVTPVKTEFYSKEAVHPHPGEDASRATPQGGPPGPWHERMSTTRIEELPATHGTELHSEYFVGLTDAGAAVKAMRLLWARHNFIPQSGNIDKHGGIVDYAGRPVFSPASGKRLHASDERVPTGGWIGVGGVIYHPNAQPLYAYNKHGEWQKVIAMTMFPPTDHEELRHLPTLNNWLRTCEMRVVEADDFWLSPCYQRTSLSLNFIWRCEEREARIATRLIEAALEPFCPRVSWTSFFTMSMAELGVAYERVSDYRALLEELDPAGKFRNDMIDRLLVERKKKEEEDG